MGSGGDPAYPGLGDRVWVVYRDWVGFAGYLGELTVRSGFSCSLRERGGGGWARGGTAVPPPFSRSSHSTC